jgi:hypothetical protein
MFALQATAEGGSTTSKAQACRSEDGAWRIIE